MRNFPSLILSIRPLLSSHFTSLLGIAVGALMANCPLQLVGVERELDVFLTAEIKLPKVCLISEIANFAWSKDYALALEKIARFDLDQSGHFEVLSKDQVSSWPLASKGVEGFAKAMPLWLKMGAQSAICLHFEDRGLNVRFSQLKQGRFKTLHRVSLSGDLKLDRQQMHRLTRQIHREWVKSDGISCCKLLYAHKTSGEQSEIWECDFDGHGKRLLTVEKSFALTPVSLPALKGDGQGVLYVSYKSGQPRIHYLAPGRHQGVRVCLLFGNQFMPIYHPQSDRLALICDHLGHPELYLQRLRAASPPQNLFKAPKGVQASPSFNPRGDRLAFVSNKDGSPRIYIADLRRKLPLMEQSAELVSRKNRENTSPAWSPDGTKLAFCAKEAGTRQIWIFDLIARKEYALTRGPEHKENPSWAPDSLHLVFNTAAGARAELYIIDLNRAKPVQISSGVGEKRFASWYSQL